MSAGRLAERWQRAHERMEIADRNVRRQVRQLRCRCVVPPEYLTSDGRCGRCFGRREESER